MTKLGAPINTANIDTTDSFALLPEGWYQAMISDTVEDANSKGTGRFIKIEFVIGAGEHSGKMLPLWINYQHDNAKAQEISLKVLARLMEAVRVPSPLKDTAQLHGKSLEIQVTVDGTYNRVESFRARAGADKSAVVAKALRSPAPTEGFSDLEDLPWDKQ